MLLFIVTAILPILIGIGLIISANVIARKEEKEYGHPKGWYPIEEYERGMFGIVCIVAGIVIAVIELIVILSIRLPIPEKMEYDKMVIQRDILEYRLDNEAATLNGNSELYNDIYDFNKILYNHKTLSNDIWLGWFCNQKIQNIDYIELNKGE